MANDRGCTWQVNLWPGKPSFYLKMKLLSLSWVLLRLGLPSSILQSPNPSVTHAPLGRTNRLG